ncbi:MAG: electron transport complex subunit RsxC [Bacteriovoracaceae bacterium]|nr:electron transport complex subunit RsxC [Bacteriovoracaceae bacterium]
MKLKQFKIGGVHPKENKLSSAQATIALPQDATVTIHLGQHLGAPATPIVKKGDAVKVGTKIAEPSGFISANIHSSVSGTVDKIDDVVDASGYKRKAVLIKVDGDEWEENIDRTGDLSKTITLSKEEIIERVKECGIVGLGGATFPTHVKLMVPAGKTAETIVVNAVECEPYLTSDHRVMLEKTHEIMIGCQIVMKATSAPKTIIGIEANKPDAIKLMSSIAKEYSGIEIAPLKVQYPQGGEKQLLNAILGKDVPPGKLPIELGAVVINVGTVAAIYEAVQKNKPLFERVITVTGKDISKPSNFLVRVGTSISSIIEAAGGIPESTGKIINGGPMMGKSLTTPNAAATKGTSGILLMTESDAIRKEEQNCIRCGKCITACAMGLEPHLLSKMARIGKHEELEKEFIMDCIECGSCSYICPSSRPLLDYIRVGKAETGKLIRERNK